MAPTEPEILDQGRTRWNAWRKKHPDKPVMLTGAELSGRDLSHFDLRGADLRCAVLKEAVLDHAILAQADLSGALLDRASMRGTILVGADLKGAFLKDALLIGAAMDGVDMRDSHCDCANFTAAELTTADLRGAQIKSGVLIRADLSVCRLNGCVLDEADLSHSQLNEVDLQDAYVRNARLERANLSGANLARCHLEDTNLEETILEGATLKGANLTGAHVKRADLTGADLREASGIVFDANRLTGAKIGAGANDPWSRLCRNYTASRMAFHLLLFMVFIAPYAAKTFFWLGVSKLQTSLDSVACPTETCETYYIVELLLGWDEGVIYSVLVSTLIAYNLLRYFLTWRVTRLRDEQEWSGETPLLQTARFWNGYGWLDRVHLTARIFGILAIVAFLWNAGYWLSREVVVP